MSNSNTPLKSSNKFVGGDSSEWRSLIMRYPNKCVNCSKRLKQDEEAYYSRPANQWSFKCSYCHNRSLLRAAFMSSSPFKKAVTTTTSSNNTPIPSLSRNNGTNTTSTTDSSMTSPMRNKRPYDAISTTTSPPKQVHNKNGLTPTQQERMASYMGMMAQMQSPRPARMMGKQLTSPMKPNLPIRTFTSKMISLCESCQRVIDMGEVIQGQKFDNGPWIVTCYPPCYDENPLTPILSPVAESKIHKLIR